MSSSSSIVPTDIPKWSRRGQLIDCPLSSAIRNTNCSLLYAFMTSRLRSSVSVGSSSQPNTSP